MLIVNRPHLLRFIRLWCGHVKIWAQKVLIRYLSYAYLADASDLPGCYGLWESEECLREVWREFELARLRQRSKEVESADTTIGSTSSRCR